MTAEVIIMNRMAIALAADSAETYRENQGNLSRQKIYQTANKLFMLSKYKPVGIMVYGSSEINHTPWEVVIKIYRNLLGKKSFNTLEEYVNDFTFFLAGFFSKADQQRILNERLLHFYIYMLRNKIDKFIEQSDKNAPSFEETLRNGIQNEVDNLFETLFNADFIGDATLETATLFVEKNRISITEVISIAFKSLPIDEILLTKIANLAGLLFVKNFFPDNASGIVIAGYGNQEYFPSMVELIIDGVVNSHLKFHKKNELSINIDHPSLVMPFAIEDMVDAFLYGINPQYDAFLRDFLTRFIDNYPEMLLSAIPNISKEDNKALLQVLRNENKKSLENFFSELEQYVVQNHLDPIRSAVNILPKEELATMAEMLVNLTSVKRRVSMQDEIVGGPIDVAVISKSDGFIWIKRKHYFSRDLNHHFFENYYNECNQEEADE